MAITTNVVSAAVIGGELIIGLADGSIIRAGMVQGTKGPPGPPGPPGPRGDDGADGATILHGEGPPRPEVGKDNDFYLEVTATRLWGPKVGGRWLGPIELLSEAARRDRARGPGAPQRSGPAFFGGVSDAGAVQQQPQQGLTPIIGNGQPFPTGVVRKIAESDRGTLFEVEIRAESATGVWVGSVRVAGFGGQADHGTWGEIELGPDPPRLTFTPAVVGGVLTLSMETDQPLTNLQGVQIMVR